MTKSKVLARLRGGDFVRFTTITRVTDPTPEAAQQFIDRGARIATCGGDHGFLVNGLKQAAARFQGLQIPRGDQNG